MAIYRELSMCFDLGSGKLWEGIEKAVKDGGDWRAAVLRAAAHAAAANLQYALIERKCSLEAVDFSEGRQAEEC